MGNLHPRLDDHEAMVTFEWAHRVADRVFSYVDAGPGGIRTMQDRRNEPPDPILYQTRRGLYLYVLDRPSAIWTPWGAWNIGGNGAGLWDDVMPHLIRTLDLKAWERLDRGWELQRAQSATAAIYRVRRVGRRELPEPERLPIADFVPSEAVLEGWQTLREIYGR